MQTQLGPARCRPLEGAAELGPICAGSLPIARASAGAFSAAERPRGRGARVLPAGQRRQARAQACFRRASDGGAGVGAFPTGQLRRGQGGRVTGGPATAGRA
ncbi:hypothetical protein EBB07_01870 [Paenibacillaceae bacterium]|nr:hypothetical protein EBB07_01870 [Paenibacillaceae bacterium]